MANPLILLNGTNRSAQISTSKPTEEKLVKGVISQIEGSNIYATLQGPSSEYRYGPLELSYSQGSTKPAVGDDCLVAFDNKNIGYLLWFGATATFTDAKVTTLEAEVSANEAKIKALEEHGAFSTTVASAYRSTEQKIPSSVNTTIKVDKAIFDPGSNFELANGYYKVPSAGYYSVSGSVSINVAVEKLFIVNVKLNGTEAIRGTRSYAPKASEELQTGTVAGIVKCAAGDKLELAVNQASGLERTIELSPVFPFCVVRVA